MSQGDHRKTLILAAGLVAVLHAAPSAAAAVSTALWTAVKNDDHVKIKALLSQHVDLNARLPDRSTVLEWAVQRQDDVSVKLLLEAGAKPNIVDGDGSNPLILSCEDGNDAITKDLLAAKADVKANRWDGVSPLALCSRSSSPDVVSQMIAAGAPVEEVNASGQSALMYAASNGRADNVALLLKHGAKVNTASNKGGFTPLYFAVKSGSVPTVQALLNAGAEVNHIAPDGTMALHLALYDKDARVATMLIQAGAQLTAWDENGKLPLHVAVLGHDTELVKLLLSKGADPNGLTRLPYLLDPTIDNGPADDDNAATAPAGARGGRGAPVATPQTLGYTPKIMLNRLEGAGAVAPPALPTTPLILAASIGSTDLMKLLIDAGAKPDFVPQDGNDLVLSAVASGKLDAVKYAVSVHPDVNGVKTDGTTAMHIAVAGKGPDAGPIIQYLADQGAKLDAKNRRGQTPAVIAARATPAIKSLFADVVKAHQPKAPDTAPAASKAS